MTRHQVAQLRTALRSARAARNALARADLAGTPPHASACETEQRVYRALLDGLARPWLEQSRQEGAGA